MLNQLLKNYNIILASGSPRRQQFFKDLGIKYDIQLKSVDEIYPERLRSFAIADYLAQIKALPFKDELQEKDILITSDTIVWYKDKALGKPKSKEEAFSMLKSLSDDYHEVITSVCFTNTTLQKTVNATTKVYFKELSDEEINFYIENYNPFDKAGAYGIQEWIGQIGVEKIEGSYFNVMGLPTHLVYNALLNFIE